MVNNNTTLEGGPYPNNGRPETPKTKTQYFKNCYLAMHIKHCIQLIICIDYAYTTVYQQKVKLSP
jgi:hypothetical protein